MNRKRQVIHGLIWAAVILAAAVAGTDRFFTTILLPVLASSAFGLFERTPCRLRLRIRA